MAFLTLLRRYDPRLRRLALRLLADPQRLDRVLARAYVKAWRNLSFLKRGEPAARWLYRIVYNACLNELRWEPVRQPPAPPEGPAVPLPAASTERRLLGLRALRATERIPLVLVDGEGFSLGDAARMMRRPEVEVAEDLARARGLWRSFVLGEPAPAPLPVPHLEPAEDEPRVRDEVFGAGVGVDRTDVALEVLSTVGSASQALLATLAAPVVAREPGGHVKLLSNAPGGLHSRAAAPGPRRAPGQPGPVPDGRGVLSDAPEDQEERVVKLPPEPPPDPAPPETAANGNGRRPAAAATKSTKPTAKTGTRRRSATTTTRTSRQTRSTGSARTSAKPSTSAKASTPGQGAGARRKNRRDVKRDTRSQERSATTPSAAKKPPVRRTRRSDTDGARTDTESGDTA